MDKTTTRLVRSLEVILDAMSNNNPETLAHHIQDLKIDIEAEEWGRYNKKRAERRGPPISLKEYRIMVRKRRDQ